MSHQQAAQDWLQSPANQAVSIWCADPETSTEKSKMGIGQKSYQTYRILYKQPGRDIVSVRHRYSEFESVRKELRDRYHPLGILVPSLPPKNSLTALAINATMNANSKLDTFFIKERTLGLTFFSEGVVASPFLRHDATWKAFLRPTSSFPSAGSGAMDDMRQNEGEYQLINVLSHFEVPYKYTMNARIEEIKEEVSQIERQAKFLLDKVRAVQSAEIALQNAQEQVKVGLHSWFDAERLHIKTLNGRIYNENEPVYPPAMSPQATIEGMLQMATRHGEQLSHNGEYLSFTLLAVLEFELGLVESFKELFKIHEEMVKGIEALTTKIQKTEQGKAANKMELLQELKASMEEKVACLNAFFKGFSYITLPLIARHRAAMYRRLLSSYSLSRYSAYFMMQEACLHFFASIQINSEVVMDELFRILDTVDVKKCARVVLPIDERFSGGAVVGSAAGAAQFFLPLENQGISGLFERAVAISHPDSGSGGSSGSLSATSNTAAAGGVTHLFTQSVAQMALATPTASSSTVEGAGEGGPHNPLARRGSAVRRASSTASGQQFNSNNPFAEHDTGNGGYPAETEETFV